MATTQKLKPSIKLTNNIESIYYFVKVKIPLTVNIPQYKILKKYYLIAVIHNIIDIKVKTRYCFLYLHTLYNLKCFVLIA